MDDKKALALISWINTLELSKTCTSLTDLCDGQLISEALSQMDASFFEPITMEFESSRDNWLVKQSNLKKILTRLDSWYKEKIGIKEPIEDVNISAIAKENNEQHIILLLELVVGVAVECVNKSEYIQKIMSNLNESQQHQLMIIIKEAMGRHQAAASTVIPPSTSPTPPSPGISARPPSPFTVSNDDTEELQLIVSQLNRDKAELERRLEDLNLDYSSLVSENTNLRSEKESFINTVKELEEQITSKEEEQALERESSSNNEEAPLLSSEITRGTLLEEQTRELEEQQHVLQEELTSKDEEITRLRKEVEDLSKMDQEARRLKDELDLAKERIEAAHQTEQRSIKIQKKVEELSDLKDQLTSLHLQNSKLNDKVATMEDEDKRIRAKLEAVQQKNAQMKVAAQRLTTEENEDIKEGSVLSSEVLNLKEENSLLQSQLSSKEDTIRRLQDDLDSKILSGGRGGDDHSTGLESLVDNDTEIALQKENQQLKAELADIRKDHLSLQGAHQVNLTKLKNLEHKAPLSDETAVAKLKAYAQRASKAEARLETAKTMIRELRKKAKQEEPSSHIVESYEETIRTLKQQLEEQRKEIALHKTFLIESKESSEREQRLLVSAFYDIGLKLAKTHTPSSHPKSFLNKLRTQGVLE